MVPGGKAESFAVVCWAKALGDAFRGGMFSLRISGSRAEESVDRARKEILSQKLGLCVDKKEE